MEGVNQLLPSVINKQHVAHLEKYMSTCEEHVAFYGEDKKVETYVKLVNNLLNNNEDRFGGLLVLKGAIHQCSIEVFTANARSWMTNCLKASNDKDISVINLAFSALGTILKMAVKFPEIKKHASTNVVPLFLDHTKRTWNMQTIHALMDCLEVCMEEYSGPCGEFTKQIKKMLTDFVDSEPSLVSQGAKCFALLSQVKGTANRGVSYQEVWKSNQLVLVNTLHYYLDMLFTNVTEIETSKRPSDVKKEDLLLGEQMRKCTAVVKVQLLARRIKGIAAYLQSMLLGAFPVPKPILPDAILGAVCRALSVTCSSLGPTTHDSIALGSILPEIHVHLFKVLISLMQCCGRNLIPYGSLICKLASQELKWTASTEWPYALDKPYRSLRAVVYGCLRCWLSIGRSASSLQPVLEDVVPMILSDVIAEKPSVTLKVTIKGQGSLVKANPEMNFNSESRSDKLGSDYANEELCLQALKCLQLILFSYTTKLKTNTCKNLQESIVSLMYRVQDKHSGPPIPYRSISCRRELYNTLILLCIEPHSTVPPPLTHSISVLNRGLMDSATEISVLCMAGLSSLEKIIHPSAPSLPGSFQLKKIEGSSDGEAQLQSENFASINDIPLSFFPNLNNITVIKVMQRENSDNTSREENGNNCNAHDENSENLTHSEEPISNDIVDGTMDHDAHSEESVIGDGAMELDTHLEESVILKSIGNGTVEHDVHLEESVILKSNGLSRPDSLDTENDDACEQDVENGILKPDTILNASENVIPLNYDTKSEGECSYRKSSVVKHVRFLDQNSELSITNGDDVTSVNLNLKRLNDDTEDKSSAGTALNSIPIIKKLKKSPERNGVENSGEEKHEDNESLRNNTDEVNDVTSKSVNNDTNHEETEMLNCFVDVMQS